MNKQRRSALARALPLIAQAQELLEQARQAVSDVRDEEQEAYDNLSEGAQAGDQGDAMQTAIDGMDEAMDAIASFDVKEIAKTLAGIADRDEETVPPTLTPEEAETRRMARLPKWAKAMIDASDRRARQADERLAELFGEPDEEKPAQIVVDDYESPVRGKVVPATMVSFPSMGIRVRYDDRRKAIEIQAVSIGTLVVLPYASNTLMIRTERF